MTILHIPVFHGIAPRIALRKLNPAQSQIARNCDLFNEELRPLKDSVSVNTPSKVGEKLSIYLLPGDIWLHWITDVDVARSPLFLDNESRIYYTGDYNPKSTDTELAVAGVGTDYPNEFYRLGVPRPDNGPTLGHTSGFGNDFERSYIYTFVSDWGEEGPPSPVTTYVGKADATSWDLTDMDGTPPNSWSGADIASVVLSTGTTVTFTMAATFNHFFQDDEWIEVSGTIVGTLDLPDDIIGFWQVTRVDELTYTITLPVASSGTVTSGTVVDREAPVQQTNWTKRIYRTLGPSFYFVADTTNAFYTDSIADEDLGEIIPWDGLSEQHWWKSPNSNMSGMIAFPGGILAGFFGNTLAFSEPGIPSAWPEKYQYNFNHDIVSIGVVGNTVVVTTNGFPSVVAGDHPSSMVVSELEIFQSCVSKRGTASLVNGVLYPSPDGIVYVPSVGLPSIISRPFLKKKDWDKFAPDTIIAELFDDRYYGFYTGGGEEGDESGAIVFDPQEPGATFTTLSTIATAVHNDLENDALYMMEGDVINKFDSGGSFLTYTWLSKLFTTRYPVCFKAAKVKLTLGSGVLPGDRSSAIAAAITALEIQLAETVLDSAFGTANNFYGGGIGMSSVGEYAVAGGPYAHSIEDISASGLEAYMRYYAWYDNGIGYIERHLVHTEELNNNQPFRIPSGFTSDQHEIEFNCSDVTIHEVLLGTSMRELTKA